jgi:N-methylhydantoinase A/oxoprolinase/acetone carboxylase beta subunit
MQSNGGLAGIAEAEQSPVTTLLSGPAAGVVVTEQGVADLRGTTPRERPSYLTRSVPT